MLRPYQQQAKNDVYEAFKEGAQSVVLVMPTGSGKTPTIADICSDVVKNHRHATILVHREELLRQAASTLKKFNVWPGIIAPKNYTIRQVNVAMVQTLVRRKSLVHTDVIIIDECHHATANSYREIIKQFPKAKIIGVTATPERLDGRGLGDIFEKMVLGPTISELIEMKYLVPSDIIHTPLESGTLSSIATKGGDFDAMAAEAAMERNVLRGDLVETYKRFAMGKKVIVYAASVKLSKQYAKEYNEAGISAVHVDGSTSPETRAANINLFRTGHAMVLCNCNLVEEGFDVPDCEGVQLAKPTKSVAAYLQRVGRGMRPFEGKTHCIIMDHAENVITHGAPEETRTWELNRTKKREKEELPPFEFIDIGLPEYGSSRRTLEHDKTVRLRRIQTDTESLEWHCKYFESIRPDNPDYKRAWIAWCDEIGRKPNAFEIHWMQRRSKKLGPKWAKDQMALAFNG